VSISNIILLVWPRSDGSVEKMCVNSWIKMMSLPDGERSGPILRDEMSISDVGQVEIGFIPRAALRAELLTDENKFWDGLENWMDPKKGEEI
jgi:hypothetical protein